jgi:hypothetical protein
MLTTTERDKAERAAKVLWDSLDNEARGVVGDELVLGTFNWGDWTELPRPIGALAALDRLRMNWEI